MRTNEIQHADGVKSWLQNGIPVLQLTHRADEEKREEYRSGKRRLATKHEYDVYVKELRCVGQYRDDIDVNELVDTLTSKVVTEDEDGNRQIEYEIEDQWFTRSRRGVSQEEFDQEYRCKVGLAGHRRVYSEFRYDKHVVAPDVFPFDEAGVLIRGWDPSNEWTAVSFSQISSEGRFIVYKTFTDQGSSPEEIAMQVSALTSRWFPLVSRIVDYGDIGYGRSRNSGDSFYQVLQDNRILVRGDSKYGVTPDDRVGHMRALIATHHGDYPMLLIVDCPENRLLLEAMMGEYRYKLDGETIDKKKRPYADIVNSVEYPVCNATERPSSELERRRRADMATQSRPKQGRRAIEQAAKSLGLRLKYDMSHKGEGRKIVKRW